VTSLVERKVKFYFTKPKKKMQGAAEQVGGVVQEIQKRTVSFFYRLSFKAKNPLFLKTFFEFLLTFSLNLLPKPFL
jgi:hypothetical protein